MKKSEAKALHCPRCGCSDVIIRNTSIFQILDDDIVHSYCVTGNAGVVGKQLDPKSATDVENDSVAVALHGGCGHDWLLILRENDNGETTFHECFLNGEDVLEKAPEPTALPEPSPDASAMEKALSEFGASLLGALMKVNGVSPELIFRNLLVNVQQKAPSLHAWLERGTAIELVGGALWIDFKPEDYVLAQALVLPDNAIWLDHLVKLASANHAKSVRIAVGGESLTDV